MFQIVEIQPAYCPSTDAIVGSTARLVPGLLIHTAAWAHRKAGLLSELEAELGDGYFRAIPAGAPLHTRLAAPVSADAWDEVPF